MPFAEPPPALVVSDFDLAQAGRGNDGIDLRTIKPRCPISQSGEIVVCAPDPEKERARPLPDAYAVAEALPRAEIDVGGGVSLDVHLDSGTLPNGYTANRVMVGVKFKF
jgi:hypothetical protein